MPLRILTAYEKGMRPAWIARVEIFRDRVDDWKRNRNKKFSTLRKIQHDLSWAWRLFQVSRNYDMIYTGSDWDGLFFAIAQRLLRKNKVPYLFIDFLVNMEGKPIEKRVRRILYRLAVQGACRVLVQRTCEVELFSQALGVCREKFTFVPYHQTLYETPYAVKNDGYIFAGGDSHRDYPLLLEAVRALPYRVVIACFEKHHFLNVEIPKNVEIHAASQAEYVQLMAGSTLTVVPLKSLPQHVGGEQTYANSMSMGKPTIITDLYASDYIVNGSTGILTPPGDVQALRRAIETIMENSNLAQQIGSKAMEASKAFTPEKFFEAVFRISEECLNAHHFGT